LQPDFFEVLLRDIKSANSLNCEVRVRLQHITMNIFFYHAHGRRNGGLVT